MSENPSPGESRARAGLRMPEISGALEQAMSEVFPSQDPVDQPEFDPVAYLNQVFPDEASLENGSSLIPPSVRKCSDRSMDGKSFIPMHPFPRFFFHSVNSRSTRELHGSSPEASSCSVRNDATTDSSAESTPRRESGSDCDSDGCDPGL